jgi:hypothetical protein
MRLWPSLTKVCAENLAEFDKSVRRLFLWSAKLESFDLGRKNRDSCKGAFCAWLALVGCPWMGQIDRVALRCLARLPSLARLLVPWSCPVLSRPVLSCPVLSCPVLSCFALESVLLWGTEYASFVLGRKIMALCKGGCLRRFNAVSLLRPRSVGLCGMTVAC